MALRKSRDKISFMLPQIFHDLSKVEPLQFL